MQERGWIEPIVERVVGEVLDSHVAQLRTEIVRRVMEEIAAVPQPAAALAKSASTSGPDLARAVSEIHLGTSQKEILRALLDTSARYADRVALFVVKGSHATGWQARGFANSDGIKDFALDERAHAVVRAIGERVIACAAVRDLDTRFLNDFGAPASGEAQILPLILKDKVAALIYADSGTGESGHLDAGALELLVLSTGAWLEVNSLRKQAHKEPSTAHSDSNSAPVPHASAASASAFNDPFASHNPSHAMAAAASAGESFAPVASAAAPVPAVHHVAENLDGHSPITEVQTAAVEPALDTVVEFEPALAEAIHVGHADAPSRSAPGAAATSSLSSLSAEDQDVHRKAQRFSRLLVDEIKLYNQAQVAEGRKNKDLYDRLKEAIEKSRGTYQKRYGSTVAASGNYFQHEIIRSLAEDDVSIMGANFRQ
jgi:hypothetical protein